jgi:fructokinase
MTGPSILCCGEALIDFLPRQTQDGALAFQPFSGGSIFNTSIALGRLGVPSGFFGGLSDDFFGDQLRESFSAAKVDYSLSPRSERYTILAFVKLFDGQARYSFVDEGSACRMLAQAQLPELPASVAALHFGSISIVPEPSGGTLEHLCGREHQQRLVSFDPNIRPGLIQDKASHIARIERFAGMADVIKFSDEDLAWMAEGTAVQDLAQRWLGLGARAVIMTRGSKGSVAFSRAGTVEADAISCNVADTVGAGDTFTAGFLTWLHRAGRLHKAGIASLSREDLGNAINLAARAAAITVSRPGADPPWAHELASQE